MTDNFDIVINGGGPVGMGLAIDLGQRGIRVCVIERHVEPQPIPKGQNLTQRTAEHFAAWGCEAELRAAHYIPPGAGIGGLTSYGNLLSGWHYDWLNRASVRDYYFTANARLPQYATERVLRTRAAAIPGITVLYGWTSTALAQDATGVTVTAASATGETRILRAAYAVGCDGARSFVRQAAGITETRSDHDRLMALLVFQSTELHDLLERYPGKAFYNVLHPDYDGYWLFFGRVDHGKSWFFHAPVPLDTTRENFDFAGFLHRAVGQEFALDFDYIGFWDLRISLADTYRAGRVFIAGDAAHSHPPYGGYGVNTGLEDARNLGWKLAATLQGWGGPGLLDSYDAERRPVFAATAREFIERFIRDDRDFLNTYHPDHDRAAFEAAWYNRNLDAAEVNAFEPHYDGSPLVGPGDGPSARGDHQHLARAGHHLAPPPTGAATVWTALGSGFTLLARDTGSGTAAAFRAAAQAMGVPLTVAALPPGADAAYGAAHVLVRPDTYVAWAGDTAEAAAILGRAIGGVVPADTPADTPADLGPADLGPADMGPADMGHDQAGCHKTVASGA